MTFEVIKDLVQVITRNKVKQIEVLGNPDQDESRLNQLYNAILKGKVSNEEEAAALFFPDGPKSSEYKKLRAKLIRQLCNSIFFIDNNQPMFSDLAIAYHNCQKDYAMANLLMARSAFAAGSYLLNQVLEQSIKYEFTELTAEITRLLRKFYNENTSDRTAQEKMARLHREYEDKRRWEMDAFDHVSDVYMHYSSGRSANLEISASTKEAFDRLYPKLKQVNTAKFYNNVYLLGVTYYFLINDCTNALQLCNTAIEQLTRQTRTTRGFLLVYALQRIVCLTQLRIFDPVLFEEYYLYLEEVSDKGGAGWIIANGGILHYHLYAGNYEEALKIYKKMTTSSQFIFLTGAYREIWQVYEGYLQLLYALGKIEKTPESEFLADFKAGKFENSFQVFNKERVGMNIPIMLLPILFNIIEHRSIETQRSVEALEKYRKRYLDININVRSANFMRMLFAMLDLPFKTKSAEKRINAALDYLRDNPTEISGQSFAIEIIPYENLWRMILEKLGPKAYTPMSR